MKSYEEMTESVLQRAKVCKAAQKRRTRNMAAALAAVACCAALAVLAGLQINRPDIAGKPIEPVLDTQQSSTATIVPDSPRLMLLSATASGTSRQALIEGVEVPYNSLIRVRDITGISEEKRPEIRMEERAYVRQILNDTPADNSITQYGSDTAIITLGFDGRIYLSLQDYDQVKDISVKTTESGAANLGLRTYNDPSKESEPIIYWRLSNAMVNKLEEAPDMKLSEINDTITVTVDFKDGSTEVAVIDMIVDDDGQIYVVYQGTTVTV